MSISIARIYGSPGAEKSAGRRILVDRLWPRGVSKERAGIESWMKEIAPSNELRRWYDHDHAKWDEFQERYAKELEGQQDLVDELLTLARAGDLTLVYGSKERRYNNAAALKAYLEARL